MRWYDRFLPQPQRQTLPDLEKDYSLQNPSPQFLGMLNAQLEESAAQIQSRDGLSWYGASVYVKRCIDIQGDALAQAGWTAYTDATKKTQVKQHPALDALNRPNPYQDANYFKRALLAWLRLWGNCYLYNAGTPGRPVLFLLPANLTQPVPGDNGWPAYYTLKSGMTTIRYELNEVTHLKRFNAKSQLVGSGDIETLRETLQIGGLSRRSRRTFWQNNASPAGILSSPNPVTDPEAERMVKRWVKLFRGPDKAGKTAFLSNGVTFAAVGIPPKDNEWLKEHDVEAKDISVAFGVPLVLLDGSAANYATAVEAKKTLWHETILPLGDIICTGLSSAPWAKGLTLDLDTTLIDALQVDKNDERQTALDMFNGSLISLNRARAIVGEPPLPNGEVYKLDGRAILVKADQLDNDPESASGTVQGEPDPPQGTTTTPQGSAPAPAPPAPGKAARPRIKTVAFGSDEHKALHARTIALGQKHADSLKRQLKKDWQRQLNDVLAQLRTGQQLTDVVLPGLDGSAYAPSLEGIAQASARYLVEQVGTMQTKDAGTMAGYAATRIGQWARRRAHDLAVQLQQTTQKHLHELAQKTRGQDARAVQDAVTQQFKGFIDDRSTLVTETEQTGALTEGTNAAAAGAAQDGVPVTKTWISCADDRVRDSHEDAHGQTVNWDEDFEVGAATGPGPGELSDARENVRCRCVIDCDLT